MRNNRVGEFSHNSNCNDNNNDNNKGKDSNDNNYYNDNLIILIMTMISKSNTKSVSVWLYASFWKEAHRTLLIKKLEKKGGTGNESKNDINSYDIKKKDWKKLYHPLFDSCWGYSKNSRKTLAVVLCIKWSREC